MVKNNEIPIEVKKPTETVYEIKDEIPSYEEFMKDYKVDEDLNYDDLSGDSLGEAKGYGPCKRDGCNCSCNWDDFSCRCRWNIERLADEQGKYRYGVLRSSGDIKIRLLDNDNKLKPNADLETYNSLSAIRKKESGDGESGYFTFSLGGTGSLNKDRIKGKVKAGVDLVNYEDNDVQLRLGVNADTGGSISDDGIEGKFLGFGVSVGKKTGISTPVGEVNFKDCVIQ